MQSEPSTPTRRRSLPRWLPEITVVLVSVALGFGAAQYGEYRDDQTLAARILRSLTRELEQNQTLLGGAPKLYTELAAWWPLLSSAADYREEAEFYGAQLLEASRRPPESLLELGSGGGNNAFHMKACFSEVVLTDVSPQMLEVSRLLNPECEHVVGDMRTIRLDREFDCVFVHDAVVYMTTESELRSALQTAFVHCRPGGAALFAPDHTAETFRPSTDCGGNDGEGRALRYLEWTWDPDPTDTTYLVDYAYVLRDRDGLVRVESDRHVEGLFSQDVWLKLLEEAGFTAEVVQFDHSELEPGTCHVFAAVKPDGAAGEPEA